MELLSVRVLMETWKTGGTYNKNKNIPASGGSVYKSVCQTTKVKKGLTKARRAKETEWSSWPSPNGCVRQGFPDWRNAASLYLVLCEDWDTNISASLYCPTLVSCQWSLPRAKTLNAGEPGNLMIKSIDLNLLG